MGSAQHPPTITNDGVTVAREVELDDPRPEEVRVKVTSCGVCGTDGAFVHGAFPNLTWPLTPGHEIAGTIAEMGGAVAMVSVAALDDVPVKALVAAPVRTMNGAADDWFNPAPEARHL